MSTVCAYNPEDADVSAKCHTNAAPVQLKIQQAQDLIKEMVEKLSFSYLNFEKNQIAFARNRERLEDLRWQEHWNQQCAIRGHPCATIHHMFHEGDYKDDVHPRTERRDELIRNLRYKLLHKSNSLAEEKKLIRQIKEAEDIRETLVANPKPEIRRGHYPCETNAKEVYRAKLLKNRYEQKVLGDIDYKQKKLRSLEEFRVGANKKKSRVHKIIYDLVKQQEHVQESRQAEINSCDTSTLLM